MPQDIEDPTQEQCQAVEGLLAHLDGVYHHGAEAEFAARAKICDEAGVPTWVQNNASCMAENRQVRFKNGFGAMVLACFRLDWAAHVTK